MSFAVAVCLCFEKFDGAFTDDLGGNSIVSYLCEITLLTAATQKMLTKNKRIVLEKYAFDFTNDFIPL